MFVTKQSHIPILKLSFYIWVKYPITENDLSLMNTLLHTVVKNSKVLSHGAYLLMNTTTQQN